MKSADRDALLALLELDYQRTAGFIQGVSGTAVTIRGWTVTVWLALLGAGFQLHRWEVAALAAPASVVLGLVDAYHSVLYGRALEHARNIEQVSARRYEHLSQGADNPGAERQFEVALLAHRFGLYSNLQRVRWRDLPLARPQLFFWFVYPFLAVVAVLASLLISVR